MADQPSLSRRSLLLGAGAAALTGGLGSMTACSPGNTNTASPEGGSTPLGTPGVATDPEGEITIWDRQSDLFDVFDKAIGTFTDKYPKVKVNHLSVDINAKLPNTLIAGTDVPDGAFYDDVLVPGIAPHLFDLTDLIAPYRDDIAPAKLGVATIDGRVIAVPWDLNPGLLFYRADIVEEAGVDPAGIGTYDDLLAAARAVQQSNPETKPIHLEANEWLSQLWIDMFASQQGGAMVDGNGDLSVDSDPYRTALSWLNSVYDEGLGTVAKYFEPTDIATLEAGTQVFVPWAQWFVFGPQQLLPESAGRWRATTLPAWAAGGPRSGIMGGSSFVIPAQAKNPELAWLLYEHLVFREEGYTAVYGPNDVYPGGLNTSVPSYLPALDAASPLFEPIEQLGGQDLWAVAIEAAIDMPGGYTIPQWWNKAVDYLGVNVQRMFNGQMTADEVIETSADQIQKNLIDSP